MKHILKVLLLILSLAFTACDNSPLTERLSGSWSYISPFDSTYNEIYFTRELLINNFSSVGISGVYEYSLSNDSLYLMPAKDFAFRVSDVQENRILISDVEGKGLILDRIELPEQSYRSFCISDDRRIQLQNGRLLRGTKALLKRGLMKESSQEIDTVFYIPEPEK